MQFLYSKHAGDDQFSVDGDLYKYIFKVRRKDTNTPLYFRNLNDDILYKYDVTAIDRKKATLTLKGSEEKIISSSSDLHIGWCLIDPKTIEKVLPLLNELGVKKITFIHCDYSQKNFKPNFDRLEKILINSSQQCGRSNIIDLEIIDSLNEFLNSNPDSYFLDFSLEIIDDVDKNDIKTVVIGCEGGFSSAERDKFPKDKVFGLKSNLILKSETAIVAIASKLL